VPAAGGQALEEGVAGRLAIGVEGLGVELAGEVDDLRLVERCSPLRNSSPTDRSSRRLAEPCWGLQGDARQARERVEAQHIK
jgi:hypothetical protein